MKDQLSASTAMITLATAAPYDPNYNNTTSSSRGKLDWSPTSSTTNFHDTDSDSSLASVESQVVINTFNSPHEDSDSDNDEGDFCSLDDFIDLNSTNNNDDIDDEFQSWTLSSPKKRRFMTSPNGQLMIIQVPLKNRILPVVVEDDDAVNNYDNLRDFQPRKRQKTMLSMLSPSNQTIRPFMNANTDDIKSTATTNTMKNTKITFNEMVDVLPIPTRYEYSNEMKLQLWSSIHEINENAARNTIEFASEGWDWRNVTLDNEMCFCPITKQYIHPVHYKGCQNQVPQQQQQQS